MFIKPEKQYDSVKRTLFIINYYVSEQGTLSFFELSNNNEDNSKNPGL